MHERVPRPDGRLCPASDRLAFCTPRGKFLARVCGEGNGNVLLRRTQYRAADDLSQCCQISRTMIFGKLFNARWSVERTRRDHSLRVDSEKLASASKQLKGLLSQVKEVSVLEELRGLEGVGASAYFGIFNEMILGDKETFSFRGRSRRPPLDAVNAMLSFTYSLLAHDCASGRPHTGGAWIEIDCRPRSDCLVAVAPHTGGVD